MEIILIRHGLPVRVENTAAASGSATSGSADSGDAQLAADPPLAPIGNEQAERLAQWLAFEPIDHIAVSPKLRAIQTAEPMAKRLNKELEIVPEFSEIDRNTTMYIPIEEMRKENHPQYQRLMKQEWDAAGFMNPQKFQREVLSGYERLVDQWSTGHTLVIVAHGGTINAIISHIIGLEEVFFCDLYYTSISRLKMGQWGPKNIRLWNLNEISHLHSKREALDPIPKI